MYYICLACRLNNDIKTSIFNPSAVGRHSDHKLLEFNLFKAITSEFYNVHILGQTLLAYELVVEPVNVNVSTFLLIIIGIKP